MTDILKMHGLGNDFVVIDGMSGAPEIDADQVRYLCDRHFGIGGDGVIVVRPAEDADGFMDYINSDGSLAQMCGNGVRVVAKFLVDNGYVSADAGALVVDTRAGHRRVEFESDAGVLTKATVAMGEPIFEPDRVPVLVDPNPLSEAQGVKFAHDVRVETPWGEISAVAVSMGNPHAVVFLDDESLSDSAFIGERTLDNLDLDRVGAFLESHEVFPEKANIEFVAVEDNGLHMRVFERGAGETLACGTGACGVLVAAALTGRSDRANDVHLPGGTLSIDWRDDGVVYMTGPATTVFCGRI